MPNWSNINFEWKHVDEKVLHFTRPSKKQTLFEILKILIPVIFIEIIFIFLWLKEIISWNINSFIIVFIALFTIFSIWYKVYRSRRNYLYITSKRILFHWIEWFFHDYVKKVTYDNIVNVNYSTESIFWKIFSYWTLYIQTAHSGLWDISVYHVENWKMLTHYIDKLVSLNSEERNNFSEFDASYFKNWKN
jgi:hypothetical protein